MQGGIKLSLGIWKITSQRCDVYLTSDKEASFSEKKWKQKISTSFCFKYILKIIGKLYNNLHQVNKLCYNIFMQYIYCNIIKTFNKMNNCDNILEILWEGAVTLNII